MDNLHWIIRVPINLAIAFAIIGFIALVGTSIISSLFSLGLLFGIIGTISLVSAIIYAIVYEAALSEDKAKKKKRVA